VDEDYQIREDFGMARSRQLQRVQESAARMQQQIPDALPRYRGLDPRWHDWAAVVAACRDLALEVAEV
jgi:hypothetical protein